MTAPPYRSFCITSSYGPFCTTPPHHTFQTMTTHCAFHITPIHCSFCTTNYHQLYLTTPTKQPRRNALTHPIVKPRLTAPTISHCTIMSHHVHTFHHIIYNAILYTTHWPPILHTPAQTIFIVQFTITHHVAQFRLIASLSHTPAYHITLCNTITHDYGTAYTVP